MVTKEDILKQLNDGADSLELARIFAERLNAAVREKEAADAAAAEEARKKAEAEKKIAQKKVDAERMLKEVMYFFETYYPEMGVTSANIDIETTLEIMDSFFSKSAPLFNLTFLDDPIMKFLKENNL